MKPTRLGKLEHLPINIYLSQKIRTKSFKVDFQIWRLSSYFHTQLGLNTSKAIGC